MSVYEDPKRHGLVIVAEIGDDDASYSFNDIVVWKHIDSGRFYWAQDSGCSCPSPFEDYDNIDDLTRLFSVHELEMWMEAEGRSPARSLDNRIEFLRKVTDSIREEDVRKKGK